MMDNEKGRRLEEAEEIDLIELIKFIWSRKTLIVKTLCLFLFLGSLVVFTTKNEFASYSRIIPESLEAGGSLGGLSGLAGLAGINLDMASGNSIPPQLYPELANKVSFQVELMNSPIYFSSLDSMMTCYAYFKDYHTANYLGIFLKYTMGLPGIVKGLIMKDELGSGFTNPEFLSFSKEDWNMYESFKERQNVFYNEEIGTIGLSVEMPDKYAAAQLNKLMLDLLTKDIIEYKVAKVASNLNFINERYEDVLKEYDYLQNKLAKFIDGNRNLTSSVVQFELQRMTSEVDLQYEVLKGLATQLEQAKIKVKENTPVFTVLDYPMIPVEKSKPRRLLTLIGISFVSVFISIGYLLLIFLFKEKYVTPPERNSVEN
ncbi:MAG: LPS O-antigen subunit length determinant protein (WzzB/FepE family) [Cyclobacteriaceae bacterium]|jgi:uncharacterized protein involved in exopolysaccharide biosynthesis